MSLKYKKLLKILRDIIMKMFLREYRNKN